MLVERRTGGRLVVIDCPDSDCLYYIYDIWHKDTFGIYILLHLVWSWGLRYIWLAWDSDDNILEFLNLMVNLFCKQSELFCKVLHGGLLANPLARRSSGLLGTSNFHAATAIHWSSILKYLCNCPLNFNIIATIHWNVAKYYLPSNRA